MIARFYKIKNKDYRNSTPLRTLNIDCMPNKGTYVDFLGQIFIIENVIFNIDKCEYNIYIARI